jgi:2-haloacid dehalogenase
MADGWATFDCYGTLVDWRTGIGSELARLLGAERAAGALERYFELEPLVERDGTISYREVLARTLALVVAETGATLARDESDALARSLPAWPVFPEVAAALRELRRRGWRLAILSNSDADLIEQSLAAIGVPFELTLVAGELGSYKPEKRHWQAFRERSGCAGRGEQVHVAQSLFHDLRPAGELGIPTVWINRLGEPQSPVPDRELPDLSGLPDVLDELARA